MLEILKICRKIEQNKVYFMLFFCRFCFFLRSFTQIKWRTPYMKNKYRIKSHRKPGWDYSSDGHYFITMVVQGRNCVLGQINNQQMEVNEWGEIVLYEWNKSFEMRNELFCDVFVIMPNHIHAIVTINNAANHDDPMPQSDTNADKSQWWQRKPKSISSFIGGYKSAINTSIDNAIDAGLDLFPDLGKFNRNNHFWQPNYYDHIVRNNESYQRIHDYIISNPEKWETDKFYRK